MSVFQTSDRGHWKNYPVYPIFYANLNHLGLNSKCLLTLLPTFIFKCKWEKSRWQKQSIPTDTKQLQQMWWGRVTSPKWLLTWLRWREANDCSTTDLSGRLLVHFHSNKHESYRTCSERGSLFTGVSRRSNPAGFPKISRPMTKDLPAGSHLYMETEMAENIGLVAIAYKNYHRRNLLCSLATKRARGLLSQAKLLWGYVERVENNIAHSPRAVPRRVIS